jgi:shikimate kinase
MEEVIHPSNRKTIVLVGMMGAGKTTTGFGLAQRLGIKFIDADREIEKAEGCPISEIFKNKGEEYFREIERKTIRKILNSNNSQVLSIGGNAFDDDVIRGRIKDKAISIFLEVDLDTLIKRVERRNNRPMLEEGDKAQIMTDLYNQKTPLYSQADICLNTTFLNKDTTINVIVKLLVEHITNFDSKKAN